MRSKSQKGILNYISSTYKPGVALDNWINEIFLSILVLKQDPYKGQAMRHWPWFALCYAYRGALKGIPINWATGY